MALQTVILRKKVRQSAYLLISLLTIFLSGCSAQPEQPVSGSVAIQKSVNSYTQLGFAYLERSNFERAKRAFVKALALDDDAPDALHGMALIYQQEGEVDLAEAHFRKALLEGGQFSVARNNYAAFLYRQRRYSEACEQLELTVRDTLYVNRQLAFENLGLCRLQLNEPETAERYFLRALQLDRNSGRALLELAFLREQQGDAGEAWNLIRRHLDIAGPSERGVRLALQLSEQLGKNAERSQYLSMLAQLRQAQEK